MHVKKKNQTFGYFMASCLLNIRINLVASQSLKDCIMHNARLYQNVR